MEVFRTASILGGSRGYALRYKGEIAAFGCLVPCRFLTGSGSVASCNVIDWAASKAVPGAGPCCPAHTGPDGTRSISAGPPMPAKCCRR